MNTRGPELVEGSPRKCPEGPHLPNLGSRMTVKVSRFVDRNHHAGLVQQHRPSGRPGCCQLSAPPVQRPSSRAAASKGCRAFQ